MPNGGRLKRSLTCPGAPTTVRSVSRLPFPSPEPSKPASEQAVITVSQLAARIDGALKSGLSGQVRFVGEVTGFRDRTHWYFDLKDAGAVVSCVMFQSAARRAGFTPVNGQQVVVRGLVEFYAKGGKVSVILESIAPVGAGALELAYRALCEELKGLAYFDPQRKAPLPIFPRRVAVVTSRTGAALQDVLVTMRRRCPAVGVLVVDVRVQGERAAAEIAEAIRYLNANADELGIDAILLTRGGGSMEDLWAFNERVVADAIFSSQVPIVAAIGHETDTTIAELVADERCATPTQAAMRLTPDTAALLHQVDSLSLRLTANLQRLAKFDRQRLLGVSRHPFFANPRSLIARSRDALERGAARLAGSVAGVMEIDLTPIEQRLERAVRVRLQHAAGRSDAVERHLGSVGPAQVLARGFSITTNQQGRVLRSPSEVKAGEVIQTRLVDGAVRSVVGDGVVTPLPLPAPMRRAKKQATGTPAPGLFDGPA